MSYTKKLGKIYCLKDPFTLKIRYIGFTTTSLNNRFSAHKHDALVRLSQSYKDKWFRKCNEKGKIPLIELLEDSIKHEDWEDKENFYISKYKNLTNQRKGGCGIVIDRNTTSIQRSVENKKKKIVQLTLDGELIKSFKCIRDAERELNIPRSSRIGLVCNKKAQSALGYRWAFLEDYKNGDIPEFKSKSQIYNDRYSKNALFIRVIDTLENLDLGVFHSISKFLLKHLKLNPKKVFPYISPKTGLYLKRYKIIKI